MIEECLAVEFRVTDDDCPLADASRAVDVRIDAEPPQLRADGNVLLRFHAPTSDRLRGVLDADDRVRYLHVATADGRDTFRCLSKHPCVVHDLVSGGFIVEEIGYQDGKGEFFGAVVGRDVLRGVMERAGETVGVRLERIYPLQSAVDVDPSQQWNLTPRQAESIRVALELGYFETPREVTATDVAEELGISKSAFLERLHRGEAALFSQLFR